MHPFGSLSWPVFIISSLLTSAVNAQNISTSLQIPPLQWINLSRLYAGGSQPTPLRDSVISYDPAKRVLIIYGGESSAGVPTQQTYVLEVSPVCHACRTKLNHNVLPALASRSHPCSTLRCCTCVDGHFDLASSRAAVSPTGYSSGAFRRGIRPGPRVERPLWHTRLWRKGGIREYAFSRSMGMWASVRYRVRCIVDKGDTSASRAIHQYYSFQNEFWADISYSTPLKPLGRWGAAGGTAPASSIQNVETFLWMTGGMNATSSFSYDDVWQVIQSPFVPLTQS